jgi:hypothetical protein
MSSYQNFNNRELLLGAANNARGMINTTTLAVAMVLSIMVINNYRQCKGPNGKAGGGYKGSTPIVDYSYYAAVLILIAAVLLFGLDLLKLAKVIR